jgi:hypothetical protein
VSQFEIHAAKQCREPLAELREQISKPIKFQWGNPGADQPTAIINGFDVTLLIA